jgi:glycine cleavage system H protein
MNYPEDLAYTKSHEWGRFPDRATATVGRTEFAQHELGDLVFVNLPVPGDEVTAGEPFADVESVKAVSDVFSPVTGTVLAVNEALLEASQLINESPYAAWLVKIGDITGTEDFMNAEEYEQSSKPGGNKEWGGYLSITAEDRARMLEDAGFFLHPDLFSDLPASIRQKGLLKLPLGLSELEVRRKMESLAAKNIRFPTVLRGAGAYRHYIPSVVKYGAAKEEFVTAYTPYQAEISQGILQSIFEYQTMIADLTAMDAANASVYDGGVAPRPRPPAMCRERAEDAGPCLGGGPSGRHRTMRTYSEGANADLFRHPGKRRLGPIRRRSRLFWTTPFLRLYPAAKLLRAY